MSTVSSIGSVLKSFLGGSRRRKSRSKKSRKSKSRRRSYRGGEGGNRSDSMVNEALTSRRV